jgi:radical SAM protein with 4Fe4S-binding SPASM domain
MSEELFHKIADEAVEIDLISYVMYHGLGEPLLDARLEKFIAYFKEKKQSVGANLFTNGVYLYNKRFDTLKEAGLNSLVISLNANTQEQHERIMGIKGKFDQTVEQIVYAIANRGDMNVEVHAVNNKDTFPNEEAIKFIETWGIRDKGGYGLTVVEGNWSDENRTIYEFKPNQWCSRSTSAIYVTYDGKVTTCCFDPLAKNVFGDLNTQTLREVYASDKYVQFRKDHVDDKADRWDICKKCTRI